MATVRVLVLIVLFLTMARPASAMDDPVAAWIALDTPSHCDQTGWSLPAEGLDALAAGTLDSTYYGACQYVLEAMLVGSCYEPISHAESPETVPEGRVSIVCFVVVGAMGDQEVVVDPHDFFLADHQDISYEIDINAMASDKEDDLLKLSEANPNDPAFGWIVFNVDAHIEFPFLLAWWPCDGPGCPVAIVMDRIESWVRTPPSTS